MEAKAKQVFRDVLAEVRTAALAAMAAWVSALADRFTNPIAGMLAALDMVDQRRVSDPVAVDSIERIRICLLGLGGFVTELVDFTKPAQVSLTTIDLASFVGNLVSEVRLLLPSEAVLRLDVHRGVELIQADPEKLRRIFRALIDNAVQAVMPPSVPVMLLSIRCADVGDGVVLSLEDNGPGFLEEVSNNAIEPFVSTKEAGTGLGLAIAQKYIEAHQGRLDIGRSQSLGGARVAFHLPRHPVCDLAL